MENKQKAAIGNGCKVFKKCGGCQLQNLDYESQLAYKQSKVKSNIGKFCHINPIIGMNNPVHYRNKVQAAFGFDSHRNIVSGIYQSSTHKIVSVDNCMIEDEIADKVIQSVRKIIIELKIPVYNERKNIGIVRHVLVKRGFSTGEIMVVIVGTKDFMPNSDAFVSKLLSKHPDITTIVYNKNNKFTSMVLGDKESVLFGKGYIEDILCGCKFRISSRSFYQINPVQTEIVYSKAIELANLSKDDIVMDAYCGIGTIGIIASKYCKQVYGVELNKDAVKDAKYNAGLNNISNIKFICHDATEFMIENANIKDSPNVLFLDPPRAGTTEDFVKCLAIMSPRTVVYISCNPETLGRDLYYFKKHGYKAKIAQPVDMFPHTAHVETVCLLSKLSDAKHHVEVELNLDEMDMTSAESKATYEEIKAYVQEHAGLNVTKLYIAQTKRKCGIIERENYNLPKNENSRQPQCPPEKEAAIKDALKHFGMI